MANIGINILILSVFLSFGLCECSLVEFHTLSFPNSIEVRNSLDNNDDVFGVDLKNFNITMLQILNSVKNVEEFGRFFGFITPRIHATAHETNGGLIQVDNAGCNPLLSVVPLKPVDPQAIYYPSCVLLPRCGGCCYGSLLSCQPVETENVTFNVMRINLEAPSSSNRIRGEPTMVQEKMVVEEVRHTKCLCQCILKEKDCNPITQTYSANECSCTCIDKENESRCYSRDASHFWDHTDCRCYCRRVVDCSSGQFFDHETCDCVTSSFPSVGIREISFNDNNG